MAHNPNAPIDHHDFHYPHSQNRYAGLIQKHWGEPANHSTNEIKDKISAPDFHHNRIVFYNHTTEYHPGIWRKLFPNAQPLDNSNEDRDLLTTLPNLPKSDCETTLHVEIGCNAGHVIVPWAHLHHSSRYIGIDWKHKAIYKAAQKAERLGLKNILFFRAQAERLPFIFGMSEIDHLHIYFPDPWSKTRQKKKRLLTHERLIIISTLIKKGGTLTLRTDHKEYFQKILLDVSNQKQHWEIVHLTHDLHCQNPNATCLRPPEVTIFEKLFIEKQIPIYSLQLTCKK